MKVFFLNKNQNKNKNKDVKIERQSRKSLKQHSKQFRNIQLKMKSKSKKKKVKFLQFSSGSHLVWMLSFLLFFFIIQQYKWYYSVCFIESATSFMRSIWLYFTLIKIVCMCVFFLSIFEWLQIDSVHWHRAQIFIFHWKWTNKKK